MHLALGEMRNRFMFMTLNLGRKVKPVMRLCGPAGNSGVCVWSLLLCLLTEGMLTLRAKPPTEAEFIDSLQKLKLALNLLVRYHSS